MTICCSIKYRILLFLPSGTTAKYRYLKNSLYLCVVAFLFLLAIFDLFVGMSNDFVNFLNSAINFPLP